MQPEKLTDEELVFVLGLTKGWADSLESDINFSLKCKIAVMKFSEKRDNRIIMKSVQLQCIKSALLSDTIVCLPTGYGKSLVYQLLPFFYDEPSIIIVIAPLNAIINEQIELLGSQAKKLDCDILKDKSFQQGDYIYAIGHPEAALDKSIGRVLKSYGSRVKHVVVDEAHCVIQWGGEFRPQYQNLKSLRALFPASKFLALTATASEGERKEISRLLVLKVYTTLNI